MTISLLTLKPRHAPANGLAFWIALCLASVLRCNTGDGFASFFGHLDGLPLLLGAFLLTLFLEQRDGGSSPAFYWVAILVVRTAATNLADWCAHAFGLASALVTLTVLLLAAIVAARALRGAPTGPQGLPVVDGAYWLTMLLAGTLGTALGDFASFKTGLGLGLGGASIALTALVAVLVGLKTSRAVAVPVSYWLLVVAIRTAGTSVGDFFAHLVGLWQSTLVSAVLLAAFLWGFPRRNVAAPKS